MHNPPPHIISILRKTLRNRPIIGLQGAETMEPLEPNTPGLYSVNLDPTMVIPNCVCGLPSWIHEPWNNRKEDRLRAYTK